MKKLLLLLFISALLVEGNSQSKATDFTANDCDGVSHNLFSELDQGNVIVIAWVMPCGSCSGPSQLALQACESFANSHPGRVKFYLCDDFGNSSCSTIENWANANDLSLSYKFSSPNIKMSDYGAAGMPKIAVLGGGTEHNVYYNKNSGVTKAGVENAITQALGSTAIKESTSRLSAAKVFPNPVTNDLRLEFNLGEASSVQIEVINLVGEKIQVISENQVAPGRQERHIDAEAWPTGIYFVKVRAGSSSQTLKFTVTH